MILKFAKQARGGEPLGLKIRHPPPRALFSTPEASPKVLNTHSHCCVGAGVAGLLCGSQALISTCMGTSGRS